MRKKAFISIGLMLLLSLLAVPVYAQGIPDLPHAFYGTVTINNGSAPLDTEIEARGTGVTPDIPQNPLTTTVAGEYGSAGLYLLVQGDIPPLATITFYVDGRLATTDPATVEWHSGETTEVDLSVIIAAPPAPPAPPGVGAEPEPKPAVTDVSAIVDAQGVFTKSITAVSEDGNVEITIAKGTIGKTAEGEPISEIGITKVRPPEPPADSEFIGLNYNLEPSGATFNPPITITFTYNAAWIPEGVEEENLNIAYWDEDRGWVFLDPEDITVDPATNTISAKVSHFTYFSVIASTHPAAFTVSDLTISPAEVDIAQSVTISVTVTNTGDLAGTHKVTLEIDGEVTSTEKVTVAGHATETVTFTAIKGVAGTYTVTVNGLSGTFLVKLVVAPVLVPPPPAPAPAPPAPAPAPPAPAPPAVPPAPVPPPTNWFLIGGIIGGAVIVGLLIYFLVFRFRRRAY